MFFPFFELCAILIQELTTLRSSLRVTSFLALTRCSFRSPSYLLVGRPCALRAFNDTVISGFHSAAFFVRLSSQCAATLFFYPPFPSPVRFHAILNIVADSFFCATSLVFLLMYSIQSSSFFLLPQLAVTVSIECGAAALVSVVIALAFIGVLASLFPLRILAVFCFLVLVLLRLLVCIVRRVILLCAVRFSFACSRVTAHVSDPHVIAGDATAWKSLILFSSLLHLHVSSRRCLAIADDAHPTRWSISAESWSLNVMNCSRT